MCSLALVPHHVLMHPEMSIQIATLRYEELIAQPRRLRVDVRSSDRRSFLRRRRNAHGGVAVPPPRLVLLRPPREERDTTGRRVA